MPIDYRPDVHVFLDVVNQHYHKRVSAVNRSIICIGTTFVFASQAIEFEIDKSSPKEAANLKLPYLDEYSELEGQQGTIGKLTSRAFDW